MTQANNQNIWWTFIEEEMKKDYFIKLKDFVASERRTKEIYPSPEKTFEAFALCDYWNMKVVILGQDPYHTPNTAHGLAFSTLKQETPPSLQNIFVEIKQEFLDEFKKDARVEYINPDNVILNKTNNLSSWASEGVLLLNTVLTVEKGNALSHAKKGWEEFTKNTITWLNNHPRKLVYMLWGKHAQEYEQYIDQNKHLVLTAPHPSPFSANTGFFGCKHFAIANEFIMKTYNQRVGTISWHLSYEKK